MRLNINLATQPYQDARSFAVRWASILGGLLVLAAVLSYAVVTQWQTYRHLSAAVDREKKTLADYDTKQQQDLAILNRAENQDVRQQSEFLNELIRHKQVSWTKIFGDLEKIMPARLRVLSVEPSIVDDQIFVKMLVGGDSRERAAELVRRMEQSGTFRYAQVVKEDQQQSRSAGMDPLRFEITAEYNTASAPNATASNADQASEGGL
jgi:hypothetical protein